MGEWITLCDVSELPNATREVFGVGNLWIAVFCVSDRYYAIQDLCTHDGGPLAEGVLEGYDIICPRHGAHFDIRNGRAKTIAITSIDVPWYETRVNGTDLEIYLP
ncbi:hypothetical protein MASR2M15_19630 [Anaerolineales bacterium]